MSSDKGVFTEDVLDLLWLSQHDCYQKTLIAVHSEQNFHIAHRPRIIIKWSCLIVIYFLVVIIFTAFFLVTRWGSGWFAIAYSDIKCSSAGLKQTWCLMAWFVVALCSQSCFLSCLGSQQRFGWADSPMQYCLLNTQLNAWVFYLWIIFRSQRSFLLFACSPHDQHGWVTSL